MTPNRGPVVFTALYVAALILSWITLLSLERFGESELKAWAPYFQAILSAGAIFSAWWLQDRKHRMEAKDTAAAAATVFAGVSRSLARYAIFLRKRCRKQSLTLQILQGHKDVVGEDIQYLRSFPLISIRDPELLKHAIGFVRQARIFYVEIGRAEDRLTRASTKRDATGQVVPEEKVLNPDFFDRITEDLLQERSKFVSVASLPPTHPLAGVGPDSGAVKSKAAA